MNGKEIRSISSNPLKPQPSPTHMPFARHSIASSATRRLLRHRVGVVWLCLIALVWCQFAAASQFCVLETMSGNSESAAMASDHAEKMHHCAGTQDDCCPITKSIKLSTHDLGVNLLPLIPERFVLVRSLGVTSDRPLRSDSNVPSRPPPHFLGQLLI
ncbi:MAG: hypothetical protein JSS86_12240 [Cyanobacteria bacterium SZAS LIN-2]|nr:hypothetical protein [Cyanobacteria bacterium SZAS LIN-2]